MEPHFLIPSHARRLISPRALAGLLTMALSAATLPGCVNMLAMAGKVFLGDPKQISAFEMATGVSLKKSQKRVLLYCSATNIVTDAFGHLPSEVEEELIRRMKRRGLAVLPPESAIDVVEAHGGVFDANVLAREIHEADYIVQVEIDHFSYMEHASPNLYRARSGGTIKAYEVRGEGEARVALQVFSHEFRTEYPPTNPIPVDQVSQSVFIRRAMGHLADILGTLFYDVRTSELIAE